MGAVSSKNESHTKKYVIALFCVVVCAVLGAWLNFIREKGTAKNSLQHFEMKLHKVYVSVCAFNQCYIALIYRKSIARASSNHEILPCQVSVVCRFYPLFTRSCFDHPRKFFAHLARRICPKRCAVGAFRKRKTSPSRKNKLEAKALRVWKEE